MEERNPNQRQRQEAHSPPCGGDLVDQVLLEEIELLTDLMAAVAAARGPLTKRELDSLLGLSVESTHTQGRFA